MLSIRTVLIHSIYHVRLTTSNRGSASPECTPSSFLPCHYSFCPGEEDEKYCSIKHAALLRPSTHQPTYHGQSEDCTELHLKRHFPTQSLQDSEFLSFPTKSFTPFNKGREGCFHPALLFHCQRKLARPIALDLAHFLFIPELLNIHVVQLKFVFLVTELSDMSDWSGHGMIIYTPPPHPTLPTLAPSEISPIDPNDQPYLEGVDFSLSLKLAEAFRAFWFIKEIYIRSLTSNAVSLHRPGMLWLHNQNLNMGEKTGRNRHTVLMIII